MSAESWCMLDMVPLSPFDAERVLQPGILGIINIRPVSDSGSPRLFVFQQKRGEKLAR